MSLREELSGISPNKKFRLGNTLRASNTQATKAQSILSMLQTTKAQNILLIPTLEATKEQGNPSFSSIFLNNLDAEGQSMKAPL